MNEIDYRGDNRWTVYVHIVPKALSGYDWDKYYVGITSHTVKERWQNGKGYAKGYFHKAIQKYGWENIQHEIIAEHLTEKEAKEFEIALIATLKSTKDNYGYNLTKGGDATNCNNYFLVAQYDLQGNLLNVYNSMKEAKRKTGIYIDSAIHGKTLRAGEYQWKRYDKIENVLKNIKPYSKPYYGKKVAQYSLEGKLIKIWDGGTGEIYDTLGFYPSNIISCCNGKALSFYNSQWRWEENTLPLNSIDTIKNAHFTTYYRYTLDGNFIDLYYGKTELKDKFGIHKDMVTELINNLDNNYFNGYRWTNKWYDHLPPLKDKYTKRGSKKYYYQYDINGNLIEKFSSTKEKATTINKTVQQFRTAISRCCKDVTNNFYCGYRWTNEYYEKLPPLSEKGLKRVSEHERKSR